MTKTEYRARVEYHRDGIPEMVTYVIKAATDAKARAIVTRAVAKRHPGARVKINRITVTLRHAPKRTPTSIVPGY